MKFPKEAWWFCGIVVGGTFFVWAVIQLNDFRTTHPCWFWGIITFICACIVGFIFRFKIMEMYYHIFNRNNQNNDTDKNDTR